MLERKNINIAFAQGLDLKTDPKQIDIGKFLSMENSVFTTAKRLTKRNGNQQILSNSSATYLTTLNDNLTAVGNSVFAYNTSNQATVTKGTYTPLSIDTLSLIRNTLAQTQADSAVAPNGLICLAYTETGSGSTSYKYAIINGETGQNIVAPTVIPIASGAVNGSPRVFLLGNYFVIAFTNLISATSHLQYIAISTLNPTSVTTAADLASSYVANSRLSWDGVVSGSNLYVAYNTTSGGQSIKVSALPATSAAAGATPPATITILGYTASIMSVCADMSSPSGNIFISWYNSGTGYTAAVSQYPNLSLSMIPIETITSGTILNLSTAAQNGKCTIFYEVQNAYSYDSGIPTNFIKSTSVTPTGNPVSFHSVFSSGTNTITASSATGLSGIMFLVDSTTAANLLPNTAFTNSGTTLNLNSNTQGNSASSPGDVMLAQSVAMTSTVTIVRSVGLASKAFIINGVIYFLAAYQSSAASGAGLQPSYFLINGSTSLQTSPVVVGKLAYSNGGGYLATGTPAVNVSGNSARVTYLFKDLIATQAPGGVQSIGLVAPGVYTQTGVNIATFTFGAQNIGSVEIGETLQLTGGFGWLYDGYLPVEENFLLWPDAVEATWSASGGSIHAQPDGATNTNAYYYQAVYSWTDNQGNIYRSAPSIPVPVTTTSNGTSGSITVNIPTLRLTYKIANQVKVTLYRWSVANQTYYQVTSISTPLLNDTTADSVQFVDTQADASIVGNSIIYTTGGVVENVNSPGSNIITLFDTRAWKVDAENKNLLWFSKQVIEATPVEWSDLFTYFVAPNAGSSQSTGPVTALAPMDDKLIIFKRDAIYFINGTGPDNTGANSQFPTSPYFVSSAVGCTNQPSIVLMPNGLMFQTDKGIWLLDRGLQTSYIGKDVEAFNSSTVTSAVNVPGTTQVRFTLNTGEVLVYDYFFGQWDTFNGQSAISSCIYQSKHTYLNKYGQVLQENPGSYLDGTNPVLMQFTTGPIYLTGVSGYQRAVFLVLTGTYESPFRLIVDIAFNFGQFTQRYVISPDNATGVYGSDSIYGQTSPFGGIGKLFQWRIPLEMQQCQSFQISAQEVYDASVGQTAGAGFTLSNINCEILVKSGRRPFAAARTQGGTYGS